MSSEAEGGSDPAKKSESQIFPARVPRFKLSDLVLSDQAASDVNAAVERLNSHTVIYGTWGLQAVDPRGASVAINLFGPPGTGKTACAEAIAHKLGRKIITVDYEAIESKYVGETPKNIAAAFAAANDAGAVLFFDEADSILGKRLSSVTQSADHSVNLTRAVMLKQMEYFVGVIIFATNLPSNYDPAFARRILAHVRFQLPDEKMRCALWDRYLPGKMPGSLDLSRSDLSTASKGLSGADILNAVVLGAARAASELGSAGPIELRHLLAGIEMVRVGQRAVSGPLVRVTERDASIDEAISASES